MDGRYGVSSSNAFGVYTFVYIGRLGIGFRKLLTN